LEKWVPRRLRAYENKERVRKKFRTRSRASKRQTAGGNVAVSRPILCKPVGCKGGQKAIASRTTGVEDLLGGEKKKEKEHECRKHGSGEGKLHLGSRRYYRSEDDWQTIASGGREGCKSSLVAPRKGGGQQRVCGTPSSRSLVVGSVGGRGVIKVSRLPCAAKNGSLNAIIGVLLQKRIIRRPGLVS